MPAAVACVARIAAGASSLLCLLIANPFAYSIRFIDHVFEEVADVIGHVLDHGEHFFENVPDEVRDRHPQVVREFADVLGELLGDSCVEDAFFATSMVVSAGATAAAGPRPVFARSASIRALVRAAS